MANSKATVSGDFGDLIRGAESAAKSIANLGLQMSGIKTAAKAFDVATSAVGDLINGLGKIGLAAAGIEAIGKSAAAMGMGLLQGNAALEMTTISFQTLLGSASAAQDMIKQLTDFAASTPFELTGLEANTQKLLAFGFSAKDIIPLMTSMGDAISALGGTQDNLNSLVYVMGQMRQEAHINAGDIMQMVNLGIPALQMLADHYHKTTGEIQEMISKGLIPGTDAVTIFSDSLEKKYGGMMAAQSSTFSGMLSNLQDWFSATSIILTKPLFEPAKKALQAFLTFVQSPAGQAAVNRLAGYIQTGVNLITKAFGELEPRIKPFIERVLNTAEGIKNQLIPVIDELIPKLEKLWNTFEPIAAVILKTASAFSPLAMVFDVLKGFLTGGLNGAVVAFNSRIEFIVGVVKSGFAVISTFVKSIATKIGDSIGDISNTVRFYGTLFVNWVVPAGKQLLSDLAGVIGGVLKWVAAQAPFILEKIKTWAISFVDWVIPIAGQLIQKLGAVLTVIFNWIRDNASSILDQFATWAEALASWVLPMIPQIIESLTGVLNKIILWVATKAPTVLTALLKWGLQFVNWIKPQIGLIMSSLQQLISVLLNWIAQNAPVIINEILSWAVAFLSWIDPLIPILINALARVISAVLNWISNNAPYILTTVLTWAEQFVNAFGTMIPALLLALGVIIKTIANWIFANGPAILEMLVNWAVQFLDWAMGLFDALAPGLNVFLGKILQWLVNQGPGLLDKLWGWIQQSINIVSRLFDYISPVLIRLVGMLGNWIATNAPDILSKLWGFLKLGMNIAIQLMQYITPVLADIINQIGGWISNNAPDILSKFWSFFKTAINVVTQLMPLIEPTLNDIIAALGGWIAKNAPDILSTFWSFFRTAINVVKDLMPLIEPTLKNIITALGGWVRDNAHDILNTFWGFFKVAFNVVKDLMPLIEPTLSDIVVGIGTWVTANAKDILDQFWSFFVLGVNLIKDVMTKLEPVLFALIDELGKWITKNADYITTTFFQFFTWAADNAEKLIVKLTPAIIKIIQAFGDAFTAHAGTIIDGLAGALMDSIHQNPEAWAAVGRLMIAAMFGPLGIAGDVALEYLRSKSYTGQIGGSYTDPTKNNIPKKASGDSNWRGGLVQIAEQGAELLRFANNRFMLATSPMVTYLPQGTQIFNAQQTRSMLPNPASPQQISNMYQNSSARTWDNSVNNTNSHNSNQTYYVNNQPVSRWSFEQQMKWYGSR